MEGNAAAKSEKIAELSVLEVASGAHVDVHVENIFQNLSACEESPLVFFDVAVSDSGQLVPQRVRKDAVVRVDN